MRILVVGGGGREHALCWAIAASPLCEALYCAPGNAGIAAEAECVAIGAEDVPALVTFAQEKAIDFVVVGPEGPLVAGLVDALKAVGIKAFGPNAAAARLEGSKGFMKDFFARHNIPTAAYGRFRDAAAAKAFIDQKGAPIVVKTDGLAAGKGVTVCQSVAEAHAAVDAAMTGKAFGSAGDELVIEEFLAGEEVSFFALVDGTHAVALAAAQDHKAVGDGDTGPNTGGMGAYSPTPLVDAALQQKIMDDVIMPTVRGMAAEGAPFVGVLFAGLMMTKDGPKTLEYNVRFGDPECEALMPRMKSDILPALIAAADGELAQFDVRWTDDATVVVVMAAKGYPGSYQKGTVIRGLEQAAAVPGVNIFHAGTAKRGNDIVATGGRVLAVTARGRTVSEAQAKAYQAVDQIDWPEGFCRRDIGWRAIAREKKA